MICQNCEKNRIHNDLDGDKIICDECARDVQENLMGDDESVDPVILVLEVIE